MIDHPNFHGALAQARQARAEADLARCELEELAAALQRRAPVGRWLWLTCAGFGLSVAVLSGVAPAQAPGS